MIRTSIACAVMLLAQMALPAAGPESTARVSKPFAGKFTLESGEVAAFIGGANFVAAQFSGYMETLLTAGFPDAGARYRCLAWEGDTVFEQRRDLNFPPLRQQLARVRASIVVAQFGQSEALAGAAGLENFVMAYEKILDDFAALTPRIVLVSPVPFEKSEPPLPDLAVRNPELRQYVTAIRELAERRGCLFVDLFTALSRDPRREGRLTSDGLHLSPQGEWIVAREIARALGLKELAQHVKADAATGALQPAPFESLRQSVLVKNRLWFHYWRPTNWAFLNGDRANVPSSFDHRNPKVRWFPQEMEKYGPLIESAEANIYETCPRRERKGAK